MTIAIKAIELPAAARPDMCNLSHALLRRVEILLELTDALWQNAKAYEELVSIDLTTEADRIGYQAHEVLDVVRKICGAHQEFSWELSEKRRPA